jgi:hypothetical protein
MIHLYGYSVRTALQGLVQVEGTGNRLQELFDQILTFLYAFAHWAGQLVAQLVALIVNYELPQDLIDPIGFLILLTLLLAVAEVAKKIVWLVVIAGWILIAVRVAMEVLSVG